MLVLTRKFQQQIKIGDQITVTILRVKGQTVRVGIDAPRDVRVIRGELPPIGQTLPATAENEAAQVAITVADEQDDAETSDEAVLPRLASQPAVAPLAVLASRLARRKGSKRGGSPLRLAMTGAAETLAK